MRSCTARAGWITSTALSVSKFSLLLEENQNFFSPPLSDFCEQSSASFFLLNNKCKEKKKKKKTWTSPACNVQKHILEDNFLLSTYLYTPHSSSLCWAEKWKEEWGMLCLGAEMAAKLLGCQGSWMRSCQGKYALHQDWKLSFFLKQT